MIVLSLFDGMSCGQIAFDKLGIRFDGVNNKYFASEIKKHAIKVTKNNYPNTIHIGDVTKVSYKNRTLYTENGEYEVGEIDYLIGGSPCQDLSISKSKSREGLKGAKSSLFWSYKDALDIVKPKYFLFENVASMKDADKDIITEALGVEPIYINSSNFVAQNRERYYWTNIPVEEVKAANHSFREVMEEEVDNKFYYNKPFTLEEDKTKNVIGSLDIATYETSRRVYNPDGVIGCLTCVSGGYQEKKVYDDKANRVRKLTPIEYQRLQGLPDNYTAGISNTKRYTVCGNGWTVDVIAHIFKGMKDNGKDTT